MYDTLLVPTDGASSTDAVIEHASDVATRRDASVHLLFVVDDRSFLVLDDDRVDAITDQLLTEGKRSLADASAAFEDRGVETTTELRTGTPATEIVDRVVERDVDLVVMGTHGDDPARNLLGSTSQKVVSLSPAPVLTVPIEETTGAEPPAGSAHTTTD